MKPRVRPAWDGWYQTARWKRRRAYQLRQQPVCALCEARGIITPATVCDHVDPHHGNRHAFEFGALQSLCESCHNNTKRGIERRGYDRRVGLDGWPTDPRHPAYAKRFST